METEPEYVEVSPKARRILAALAVIFLSGYFGMEWLLPLDADSVKDLSEVELETFQKKLQLKTGITALVILVAAVLWTVYLWPIVQKTLATSRFPPPGAIVVRRTKVVTGKVAQVQAFAYIFLGVIAWIPVALFAYLYYLSI